MFTLRAIVRSVWRFPLFTPESVVGFAWRFAVFYLMLAVIPRGGLREVYAKVFQAGGNAVFGSFGENGVTRFEPATTGSSDQDTTVTFKNRDPRFAAKKKVIVCSGWIMGYLPLATLVALILATPLPWPRRRRALLWGIIWIHGFILLRMLLMVVLGFCGERPVALFEPSRFWMFILGKTVESFAMNVVTSFVLPILVWALVSFRRGDWVMIVEKALRYSAPQPP